MCEHYFVTWHATLSTLEILLAFEMGEFVSAPLEDAIRKRIFTREYPAPCACLTSKLSEEKLEKLFILDSAVQRKNSSREILIFLVKNKS
jgi:hypothetical protein